MFTQDVPGMFTQNASLVFTRNVPPMFTQNVPLMFTRDVPPFPEPAPGAVQAGSGVRSCRMRLLCPGEDPGNSMLCYYYCFSLGLFQ
jgi:hypothetical protein